MTQLEANRPVTEKPLMNRTQHMAVIRGLKKEEYTEGMLKYLCLHRMDKTLSKEVAQIEEALDDLFCHDKFGYIAEWIFRRWTNSVEIDAPPLQPRKVPIFPVHIPEVVKKGFRSWKKSQSLHRTHLKKLMSMKIELFKKEFGGSSQDGMCPSKSEEKKRGTKRKLVDSTL